MILLIGGNGSIGSRYKAVLQALGEEFLVFDVPRAQPERLRRYAEKCDRVLICSPTHTHFDYCVEIEALNKPYLCEKPLCTNEFQAEALKSHRRGFVVNNWAFLRTNYDLDSNPAHISYDFFNTGKDGLLWDVCQLIYIAKLAKCSLSVRRDSYYWDVTWSGTEVPYQYIEKSYLQMMRAFLEDNWKELWSLQRGIEMTKLVIDLEQQIGGNCEGFDLSYSDSGEKLLEAFTA